MRKEIDYKYNEDNILKELQEYIDNTYTEHYSHKNFQATEFVIDSGHGEGERRTLAANANIISPEIFDWKNATDEDRAKILNTFRGSRVRNGGGGGGLGAKTKD